VAVGVAQVERAEGTPVVEIGALHVFAPEVVAPRFQLLGRLHHEREVVGRADAGHALRQLGYSMKETSAPASPSSAPNHTWREPGSSSLGPSLTIASP
jgi:hypothetical protein